MSQDGKVRVNFASPAPAPTPVTHPVTTAAQGMFMVLNAASLRRLPMPFAAKAYEHLASVELQFHSRAEVHTWAIALDVDEVQEDTFANGDGIHDTTRAQAVWLEVPLTLVASVPRMPEAVAS